MTEVMNAPKVGFVSLGCPKALTDSELILTQLSAEGYQTSKTFAGADLVIVNTCGFIDDAVKESLDTIGEALAENGKVIVTGCLGARQAEGGANLVMEMHPSVLAVTGPHATQEVMDAVHTHLPKPHDPFLDLVPGGFGERGTEGKIRAVRFARERKVPFLGICLGMQMACIEGARNTAGIAEAASTEFGPTTEPVVGIITEWMSEEGLQQRSADTDLGGTMRLGAYEAKLSPNSHVAAIYGGNDISERHRHRYEVNVHYRQPLEQGGLVFSGMSPDGQLPEIVERPDHPWFIGVQFHPELKSKPFDPHPLFKSFIEAAVRQSRLV